MKLSIIIPVYKVQNTLDRCIQSVLNQSFTDYEIILVDDGSPDECPRICDKYAKRDTRISVIHKQNGGLSDARNAGIEQAAGEYITFIDSDDSIEENCLQAIMNEIQKHTDIDMLEYPARERIGHPAKERMLTFRPKDYDNPIDYWLGEQGYDHTYAWNKVFKRRLFEHITFPKGKTFEDIQTIPYLIGLIPTETTTRQSVKIRVTDKGCYEYHWNNNGITAKAKPEDLHCLYAGLNLALIHTFKQIACRKDILTRHKHSINKLLTHLLNIMMDIYELSGVYEDCFPLIKYTILIRKENILFSPKLKLLLIIGYKRLCKLNHLLHKIYRHR